MAGREAVRPVVHCVLGVAGPLDGRDESAFSIRLAV